MLIQHGDGHGNRELGLPGLTLRPLPVCLPDGINMYIKIHLL
jgi:hypothetical protein